MTRTQQIIAETEAKYAPQWDALIARFHAAKHPDAIRAKRMRDRAELEHAKKLENSK